MSYILLIEDNQANADMMLHILNAAGYTTKHLTTGLQGAQDARKERPDLILMDFNLPDVDGRTLTLVLRKQMGEKAPPIIACTARAGDMEKVLAERFGCSAFLRKPFTPDELLAIVQQFAPLAKPS